MDRTTDTRTNAGDAEARPSGVVLHALVGRPVICPMCERQVVIVEQIETTPNPNKIVWWFRLRCASCGAMALFDHDTGCVLWEPSPAQDAATAMAAAISDHLAAASAGDSDRWEETCEAMNNAHQQWVAANVRDEARL